MPDISGQKIPSGMNVYIKNRNTQYDCSQKRMEIRRAVMDVVFTLVFHTIYDLAPFINMMAQKNKGMIDIGENGAEKEKPGKMVIINRQGAGYHVGEYHMTK